MATSAERIHLWAATDANSSNTYRDLHWLYTGPVILFKTQCCEILLWQTELEMPSSSKADWRPFKFLDTHIVIQLKHLCTILYLLWIRLCSLQRVGKLGNLSFIQKFFFSSNIAFLQIAQQSSTEGLSASHRDNSMHLTNSKPSWYVQIHKGIDYSSWQCETLSLVLNLAAGQEIRSRVSLCILTHVSESMLKPIDSRQVCSIPWQSADMLLSYVLANTCTALRVGFQGACPGSECQTVFRLFKLSSADEKTKTNQTQPRGSRWFSTCLFGEIAVLTLNWRHRIIES